MLGVDIISIARVERILARSGEAFLKRFLSKREIALCVGKNGDFNTQRIAGFYAAKEALLKALGCGISAECGFMDIKLRKNSRGAPKIKLKKRIKKHFGVKKIYLSISHDKGSHDKGANKNGGYAIAVVWMK